MPFFSPAQKKLEYEHFLDYCKEKGPIHIEKLVSNVEFDLGIPKYRIDRMIQVLLDVKKLKINKDGVISV